MRAAESASPLAAFRPKLLDTLTGYTRGHFIRDVGAGLTVGVVALPLAMAFAIASGLKPEAGLFTAIIAGFLISALGGSRVQIGGPAGAFIVIVYGILERYGLANLIIATAMSGVLLFLMGLFRLGALIRFIPIAVVIGFTNGIAVLIMLSQVKDFLGLQLASWTRRGFDTRTGDATLVLRRLTRDLAAGDILLLHDHHAARTSLGRPVLLDVLPGVLQALHRQGLRTVRLAEPAS